MGRSEYYDSINWAQPFCRSGQTGCGPTIRPPPSFVEFQQGNLCLRTGDVWWNDSGTMVANATLGACDQQARFYWQGTDLVYVDSNQTLHCLNVDYAKCEVGRYIKIGNCGWAGEDFSYDSQGQQLRYISDSCSGICISSSDVTSFHTAKCGDAGTTSWKLVNLSSYQM